MKLHLGCSEVLLINNSFHVLVFTFSELFELFDCLLRFDSIFFEKKQSPWNICSLVSEENQFVPAMLLQLLDAEPFLGFGFAKPPHALGVTFSTHQFVVVVGV